MDDSKDTDALAHFGARFVPEIIVGSRLSEIYTEEGRRILDWMSGQMACPLGHCHPEVVQALKCTADRFDHLSSCMLSPPVLKLAKRLTSLLPPALDRAMFFSTGSESNEAAIKLAKVYTGKFEIVALGQSWHGMTSHAQGAQYYAGRRGHGPPLPGQFMLPQPNAFRSIFRHRDGSYDWQAELDYGWQLIDQASCGSLAACIVECVQGDAGVHVLPDGYLEALQRHCRARDMLLIVDEAQTGLGRTGSLFAIEHEGIVPDILTLSKPLANGLPLSAVITSIQIDVACKEKGFMFYTTHAIDPLVAAVGNKTLDIILRDDLAANAEERGRELLAGLRKLADRYDCIGDVRGRGLMAGIEIVRADGSQRPNHDLATELSKSMWEQGIWCQLQDNAVFRVGPPINITADEVLEGLEKLDKAFYMTCGRGSRHERDVVEYTLCPFSCTLTAMGP